MSSEHETDSRLDGRTNGLVHWASCLVFVSLFAGCGMDAQTIETTDTSPPTEVCPAELPYEYEPGAERRACAEEGLECTYGEESCCGQSHPSWRCQCGDDGVWRCGYTDACLGATCPEPIEAPCLALDVDTCLAESECLWWSDADQCLPDSTPPSALWLDAGCDVVADGGAFELACSPCADLDESSCRERVDCLGTSSVCACQDCPCASQPSFAGCERSSCDAFPPHVCSLSECSDTECGGAEAGRTLCGDSYCAVGEYCEIQSSGSVAGGCTASPADCGDNLTCACLSAIGLDCTERPEGVYVIGGAR